MLDNRRLELPLKINMLIDLPKDFSILLNKVAQFK